MKAPRIEPVRQGVPKRLWRFENYELGPLITVLLGALYLLAILGRGCTSFS